MESAEKNKVRQQKETVVSDPMDSVQSEIEALSEENQTNPLPFWKRAFDLTVIIFLLPAIILFGALMALIIKLGSRGPLLFRQERVGYKGRHFICFKFRTMRVNAETDSHRAYTQELINGDAPMTKLDSKKDSRLIPLGAAIRATGLDELPQLINVLRGEMSIVGPRPCIPYEYELYQPWQRRRFDAVPGLTGLWQVSGKNRTTFSQMIQYDIQYARQRSLLLDVGIFMKTLPALWMQCRDVHAAKLKAKARHQNSSPVRFEKPIHIYRL